MIPTIVLVVAYCAYAIVVIKIFARRVRQHRDARDYYFPLPLTSHGDGEGFTNAWNAFWILIVQMGGANGVAAGLASLAIREEPAVAMLIALGGMVLGLLCLWAGLSKCYPMPKQQKPPSQPRDEQRQRPANPSANPVTTGGGKMYATPPIPGNYGNGGNGDVKENQHGFRYRQLEEGNRTYIGPVNQIEWHAYAVITKHPDGSCTLQRVNYDPGQGPISTPGEIMDDWHTALNHAITIVGEIEQSA